MSSFFNIKINLHIKYTWVTKPGRNITTVIITIESKQNKKP